ncbi:MAG: class I SAM-dependent methyltransferase [Lachnospiraceae bacterium]|nr:class I SAM-dependent methyltransferase [Lachnospiraceae bacterium]
MKTQDNKEFWNKTAKVYKKSTYGRKKEQQAYDKMTKKICEYINRDMNVLELACGPGMISFTIARQCRHLEATDFSENMIKEAKHKNTSRRVYFSVQDATKLPYASNTFDAVVMANALHIMPNPELALENIRKVLKEDGFFICPTFTREKRKFVWKEKLMELIGFKTYSRWDTAEFLDFIAENGFQIIDSCKIVGHNFPITFVAAKQKKH